MSKVDKELAVKMRREGKSTIEIADYFGVSFQAISAICRKRGARKFSDFIEKIPYKGIYEYMMADEKLTIPKFASRLGLDGDHASTEKLRRFIYGENVSINKRIYDNLLSLTGMTYEQVFELRDGFKEDGE